MQTRSKLLTIAEAAEKLSLKPKTLRAWIDDGVPLKLGVVPQNLRVSRVADILSHPRIVRISLRYLTEADKGNP